MAAMDGLQQRTLGALIHLKGLSRLRKAGRDREENSNDNRAR
jgi:hypothetical protein